MPAKVLPGFRDFYPAEFALREHIFKAWRDVAARYAFEQYDGPPLEMLELYTDKSGEEIVAQLYAFEDKGGRSVALRPEMTPSLARMVAARANGLKKPIRWFSIPQLFRYERQQRGRLREHFQLNCDLIGEVGPLADAEVLALAIDIMRALGLGPTDVRVRLSDRSVLRAFLLGAGVGEPQLSVAYQAVDKLERMAPEAMVEMLAEAGIAAAAADQVREIASLRGLDAVRARADALPDGAGIVAHLGEVVSALDAMGLGEFVEVDLGIVRGLAYYTGTVFELFDAGRSLRAICGGGRYDGLLGAVGGVDLPACGFGMGDVVLGELLKDRGLVPAEPNRLEVFVAGVSMEDLPHVLALVRDVREGGIRTEYALGHQPLARQLKLADARSARLAVIVGPDDRAAGRVAVKDLETNQQTALDRNTIVAELRSRLSGSPLTAHPPPSHG